MHTNSIKKNKDFMVLESKEECGGNMKSDAKKPYVPIRVRTK